MFLVLMHTACSLNDTSQDRAYFRLEGGSQLTAYSRVVVVLADTAGILVDTLYDDTLPSASRLRSLAADGYRGGKAIITIHGYRNGSLNYSETRLYDGQSQQVLALKVTEDSAIIAQEIPVQPTPNPPSIPIIPVATPTAPTASLQHRDTTVSIRDSVNLDAEAYDPDGDLAAYRWTCSGDDKAGDSIGLGGYRQKIVFGARFMSPGDYTCSLGIWDRGGRFSETSSLVHVEYDPPVADAGEDTTVMVNGKILLHGKGNDDFGPILTRAWKIGQLNFSPIPQQETSITAPNQPGDLVCILKVMDSDSLFGLDTLVVHVVNIAN